ncbi:MAG: hypothetical protein AAF533_01270 [Acidobacteriota bacterium]
MSTRDLGTVLAMVNKRAPVDTVFVLADGRRLTASRADLHEAFAGRGPWLLLNGASVRGPSSGPIVAISDVAVLEEAEGGEVLYQLSVGEAATRRRDELTLASFSWTHGQSGSPVVSRDVLLNGDSLHREINGAEPDWKGTGSVCALGWLGPEMDEETRKQLSLRSPSPLESGRVPLYVCAACGDLGCGCVAVRIELEDDVVRWSDIAVDGLCRDDTLAEGQGEGHSYLGTFVFERESYLREIAS